MAGSLTDQLKPAEQLREIFDEIRDSAEKVTESYTSQLKMIKELVDVLGGLKPKEKAEEFKEMNDTVKEVQKNVEAAGGGGSGSMKKLGINADLLEKKFGKVAKTSAYATAALTGFKQGIKNVVALSKAFTGLLSSAAQGLSRIGLSIAAIPFKMFKGFLNMAQENANGSTELAQAIENVRKQFGQFGQSSAKAVFDVTKTMGGFSETGLSTWRVFGTLAERMNYIRELATGMGVAWSHMVTHMDMKKEGGHILAYQKGLGLAAEQMKALYDKSNAAGKPITKLGVEMTKYSYAMAKQFGLSAKEVSRDVGKATQDVRHFGQLTIKEINVAATYARKLNIEFEKITGTLDAFETFDTAAENAAKLAQSFGMNVDAFKMMEAQNPADQMDQLRKAMFAAGKDADKMTRQELKLLAASSGLDEATAKQAFSFKNQGVSLDEIKKKANATENAQMSQAEAMKTLAGAIERMVKSGSLDKVSSFFDAFVKGMLAGVRASPDFIKLMMNIRFSIRAVWFEGFKLGRELIKLIPGMESFFQSLQKIFDPKKMKENAAKVRVQIENFFKDMTKGPFSFATLMDSLHDHFFNYFNNQTPEGKKILSQIKNFLIKLGEVAGQAVTYFGEKIAKGLHMLADFIKNPSAFLAKAKAGAGTGGNIAIQIFGPILDSLKNLYPIFKDAVIDLFSSVWGQVNKFFHSETFRKILLGVGPAIIGVLFGPMVTRLLAVAAMEFFSKLMFKGIEKAFESGGMKAISKFAGSKLGGLLGTGALIGAIVAMSMGVSSGMKKFRKDIGAEFSDAQKDVASGMTGIIDMLTFGLMPDWLLVMIANFGAKVGKQLQDSMNKITSGLGDNIMGYLQGYMKFFGGLGDIIFGLLQGDSDRLIEGVKGLLWGGFAMILRGIQMQFITLPMTLGKFIVGLITTIQSTLWTSVGKILKKAGLGPIGDFMITMGENVAKFGKMLMAVFNFISSAVNWVVTYVVSNFDKIGDALQWLGKWWWKITSWTNPVMLWYKVVKNVLEWMFPSLKSFFTWLEGLFSSTMKWIGKGIDWITDKFKYIGKAFDWATAWLSQASKAMDKDAAKRQGNKLSPEQIKAAQAKGQKLGDAEAQAKAEAAKKAEQEDTLKAMMTRGFDVDKAPTKAINYAKEAIQNVEEVKKKLGELSPEKMREMTDKVREIFKPADQGGAFMQFVRDVNTQVSGPEIEMAGQKIGHMSSIFENLSKMSDTKISEFGRVMDAMTKFFSPEIMKPKLEALNNAITWAGTYGSTMDIFRTTITTSGIIPALEAVQKMVNVANDLDKALSEGNIAKMNVKTKLMNVANAVGLGGRANYEIKNRGVNIQLEVKIEINAADMEKAMIMRGKSIIRDRLNNAEYAKSSSVRDGHITSIPETPSDAAPETYHATGKMG